MNSNTEGYEKAKTEIFNLLKRREVLEDEYINNLQVLQQNNTDMQKPLVDEKGYPLQGIDIIQVRNARHRICCLTTDLKMLTNDLEENLHRIHANIHSVEAPVALE